MANANYKLREVSASEIAKVFGSARRALRVTRGDEATALHFIHNPDLAATAQEWEAKWTERLTMARHTYTTHGTIAAIIRACKCDSITAKKLIAELQSEARP